MAAEKRARKSLKIVVADDSAVIRHMMAMLFDSVQEHADADTQGMEICASVNDGVRCVEAVRELHPDIVLLDLEMPRMSGMEVLDILRQECPETPVIMCSAYTARGAAETLEALARGAVDYVTKPSGSRNPMAAMASLSAQLLPKIAAFAGKPRRHHEATRLRAARPADAERTAAIVGIGVSTGGPAALELLLPRLPQTLGVPVMIVQHMPKLFTTVLAERLNRVCKLPVREAEQGMELTAGSIWLAPGDRHMEVTRSGRAWKVGLHQGPAVQHCRPSVDVLFRSLAVEFGDKALGVVLTGMGSDGLEGAREMVRAGGAVLAQDEASSAVWGMPGRVSEAGIAEAVLPLSALAEEIERRTRGADRGVKPQWAEAYAMQ